MEQHKRIHNKFEYHTEDIDCPYCQYYKGKSKFHKNGCREEKCRFDDIKQEAIQNNRIKRKPANLETSILPL